MNDKKTYAQALKEGFLSKVAINNISDFMISRRMSIEKSSDVILEQKKITFYSTEAHGIKKIKYRLYLNSNFQILLSTI